MTGKYKNIIFDLGGVLAGLDGQRCIEAFNSLGCEKVSYYVEKHLTADLFYDIEIGNITTADFCQEVRRITGCHASDEQIVWAWNELLLAIPERKLRRLLDLRNKYRLFLLSNTNDMHWSLCVEKLFRYQEWGVTDYFEQTFVSYEMHLAKPHEKIYAEVLRQADIKPEETLFIDDSKVNLEGAHALGIHGFWNEHLDDWLGVIK